MQVMTAIENASPKRRGHRCERLTATSITGQFVLAKRTQDSLDSRTRPRIQERVPPIECADIQRSQRKPALNVLSWLEVSGEESGVYE